MNWRPEPPQASFLAGAEREVLYGGAAGSGKSDALVVCAARFHREPDCNAIILRRKLTELTEITHRMQEMYRALGARYVKSERTWFFKSGARIRTGFARNREDAEQYRGEEFTFVGFEELCQWGDPGAYLALMARLRKTVQSKCVLMARSTCNPEGPGVIWVKKRFKIGAAGNASFHIDPETGFARRFVPGRLWDNQHIDREDYAKTLRGLGPKRARALLDGRWDSLVGQYFSTFNPAEPYHVRPFDSNPYWEWTAGFDQGFRHRTGFVLVGVDGDGHAYITEAYGRAGLPPERHAPNIHALLGRHGLTVGHLRSIEAGSDVFAERGQPTTIAEEYKMLGIPFVAAQSERVNGWRRMASLFGDPEPDPVAGEELQPIPSRITIHPRCHMLIEAIAAAQHDEKRPEDVAKMDLSTEDPDGVSDDELDACRYALMKAVRGPDVGAVNVWRPTKTKPQSKEELLAEMEAKYGVGA